MPPGTAPKPYGAGGPGGYGDERGYRPSELYNQTYQQQQRAPGLFADEAALVTVHVFSTFTTITFQRELKTLLHCLVFYDHCTDPCPAHSDY